MIPALARKEQEDQEFKVSLSYKVSWRPAKATLVLVLNKTTEKQQQQQKPKRPIQESFPATGIEAVEL